MFKDFTSDNYLRLLRLIKTKFKVTEFSRYNLDEKFAIIRHDVDFSVQRALKIAQIEAKEGIRAHYFILLHSEFYNLIEKRNAAQIKEIVSLGHNVGLHFDTSFYDIKSEEELVKNLTIEKQFLENVFEINIDDFSFHITNDYTSTCTKDYYAEMLNVYSDSIQKHISYCSDSNGYWRYKRLEDVINDNNTRNLQILTHPELWQDEIMSPRQRVMRCIKGRAVYTEDWYNGILELNKRENIDW